MGSSTITLVRRVSRDGSACPDGDTCPALWDTSHGTRIVVGTPVTDPGTLLRLGMADDETAVETAAPGTAGRRGPAGRSAAEAA